MSTPWRRSRHGTEIPVIGFGTARRHSAIGESRARIAALKRPDGKVVDPFGRVSAWDA